MVGKENGMFDDMDTKMEIQCTWDGMVDMGWWTWDGVRADHNRGRLGRQRCNHLHIH